MLPNASTGKLREVDIVIEGKINDVHIVISFECCNSTRKAGSPWVENMIGKHRKLPTHRLILVSGSGFSAPALDSISAEKNVDPATFEEASAVDWGEFSKRLTELRFGGFESAPVGLSVKWLESPGLTPHGQVLDSETVFRRIADGVETNCYQLALAYLNDARVRKPIMDRYYAQIKSGELKKPAGKESFTATGDFEFTVNWNEDEIEWELISPTGYLRVTSIIVQAKLDITDSPLDLSFKSFMGSKVAHGIVKNPFKNTGGKLADEISVAVTQTHEGEPVASISFTSHVPEKEKMFFAKFTADKEG